jgi:dihydrodipicolinate synthase/N-acetylneuraminate lyase
MTPSIPLDAIHGVVAMLPTPSLTGADEPHHPFGVDLEETERATQALIEAGVSAIMTNGSLGEMATLTHDEWRRFNEVVIASARAVDPQFPVFVGATAPSTHATIELARAVETIGGQ